MKAKKEKTKERGEAFTIHFGGIAREIKLPVLVGKPGSSLQEFIGVWDTGATMTVISQHIVDQLELKDVIDEVDTHSADGPGKAEAYYVDVGLPNAVGFESLKVIKMKIAGDLLIGMDIIGAGDFCLTNVDGETVLTFESPPHHRYDFVKQINVSRSRR